MPGNRSAGLLENGTEKSCIISTRDGIFPA